MSDIVKSGGIRPPKDPKNPTPPSERGAEIEDPESGPWTSIVDEVLHNPAVGKDASKLLPRGVQEELTRHSLTSERRREVREALKRVKEPFLYEEGEKRNKRGNAPPFSGCLFAPDKESAETCHVTCCTPITCAWLRASKIDTSKKKANRYLWAVIDFMIADQVEWLSVELGNDVYTAWVTKTLADRPYQRPRLFWRICAPPVLAVLGAWTVFSFLLLWLSTSDRDAARKQVKQKTEAVKTWKERYHGAHETAQWAGVKAKDSCHDLWRALSNHRQSIHTMLMMGGAYEPSRIRELVDKDGQYVGPGCFERDWAGPLPGFTCCIKEEP